jgi:hypothetical protein
MGLVVESSALPSPMLALGSRLPSPVRERGEVLALWEWEWEEKMEAAVEMEGVLPHTEENEKEKEREGVKRGEDVEMGRLAFFCWSRR